MKEQLISGTLAYLLKHGIAGLSLRPLAKALGTSNRMILYYFETKDELLVQAVGALADQMVAAIEQEVALLKIQSPGEFVQVVWDVFNKPKNRPIALLFYEIEVLSLRQPGLYRKIARQLMERWEDFIAEGLSKAGYQVKAQKAASFRIGAELHGLFLATLIRGEAPTREALRHLVASV